MLRASVVRLVCRWENDVRTNDFKMNVAINFQTVNSVRWMQKKTLDGSLFCSVVVEKITDKSLCAGF